MNKANIPVDWDALLGQLVHPTQVAVIEALRWVGQPLSATELTEIFDDRLGLSAISYHVRRLKDLGILEFIKRREVRGATERFYFFAGTKRVKLSR